MSAIWYKEAIIYQLHVKTFYDSKGDGIGDFRGLTEKLSYLQFLGINTIWLLPFYQSPLKDEGYDIADYYTINPSYGTLDDFKAFLEEAHRRNLRVMTELVINHTSDQHEWFQKSRRAERGSYWRNFYVWHDHTERYQDARIIFKDFETSNWTWDPVAEQYYWHRFYAHQPDLNFDNPAVEKEIFKVLDFWLEMGVDGLRLDAIPYLFERDHTNCENLPETHAFLKRLRAHVDKKFGADRVLLAEANQWPEDAVAYFGQGKECHMAFHFPVMPRMYMAIQMEDRYPIIDILDQTPQPPDDCQWAIFLRNHDELTLEMVTEEERDYMYRMYAEDPNMRINLGIRRRLAPLLENNKNKIQLLNALLLSLPGSPIIYYGDEIGMGDNIELGDRDGVRTPMQWNAEKNAGFSTTDKQLPIITCPEYHFKTLNVHNQRKNKSTLFWWMKNIIALRKSQGVFGSGSIEFLESNNRKVLTFMRILDKKKVLVVLNLSRFPQCVELDLSAYQNNRLMEIFGKNPFPKITEHPYLITLAPYSFYWFDVQPMTAELKQSIYDVPQITLNHWHEIFYENYHPQFEVALKAYFTRSRWFNGKDKNIHFIMLKERIHFGKMMDAYLFAIGVEYFEGEEHNYWLSLSFLSGEAAEQFKKRMPQAVIAVITLPTTNGILIDAFYDPNFFKTLTRSPQNKFMGEQGCLHVYSDFIKNEVGADFTVKPLGVEQSNSSFLLNKDLIIKCFRKCEKELNPELEISHYLRTHTAFQNIPDIHNYLEYTSSDGTKYTTGVIQSYIANEGNAWDYTLEYLKQYFEKWMDRTCANRPAICYPKNEKNATQIIPDLVLDTIQVYIPITEQLAERTAELHLALTARTEDTRFNPEPFTFFYQRSLFQSLRNGYTKAITQLKNHMPLLKEDLKAQAEKILKSKSILFDKFSILTQEKLSLLRSRHHGDLHLGQILYTGKDFIFLDFEGEPGRPLSERRLKRSPLVDVAGMLRSFHYAISIAMEEQQAAMPHHIDVLEAGAQFWYQWIQHIFLKSYYTKVNQAPYLGESQEQLDQLMNIFVLEKALYELSYELENRPHRVGIPCRGLLDLLE